MKSSFMRRAFCVVAVLALFALAATAETKSGKDSVTISFTSYFMEGETAEAPAVAYHTIMDKYLKSNPNVRLEEEVLSHDAYEQKMMALSAADELPDMFQLKSLWIRDFVKNNALGTMDGFLGADPKWVKGFVKGTFDEFTLDKKTYGIPYQIATVSNLFYNKGIFKECGIAAFPKSFTELENAILKLKSKGFIPITAGNKGGWFVDVVIFRGLLDRYAGPEWGKSIDARTGAKFTDPQFVGALKELKKISDMKAFNSDINSIDYVQMRSNFYNRKAAMMMDGSGGILPFSQEAPKEILEETEITALPPLEGGKSVGIPATGGWSFGYNGKADAKKAKVIGGILKALSSGEYAAIVTENNGFSAVTPDRFDKSKLSPLTIKYNKMLGSTPVTALASFTPALLQIHYAGLQEILIGTASPEELAASLQKEYESVK